MEQFQEYRDLAIKKIRIADHMLVMTFPIVNDPKLLLAVLENVFSSLDNAMTSLLYYERLFKRVPPFQESFDSRFNVFKSSLIERYRIDKGYLGMIQEIRELLKDHKNSPVEFARKDKFVICGANYQMKTISVPDIKKYISRTKLFVNEMTNLVNKNAGIFK